MKTLSIPIFRPEKFGASAAEVAVLSDELRAQIYELLEEGRGVAKFAEAAGGAHERIYKEGSLQGRSVVFK